MDARAPDKALRICNSGRILGGSQRGKLTASARIAYQVLADSFGRLQKAVHDFCINLPSGYNHRDGNCLLEYDQPIFLHLGSMLNKEQVGIEAIIQLPHDGVATTNISGKRYIDHWIEAGFERAPPIKNSGAGAA
jgi:hypothetical protein